MCMECCRDIISSGEILWQKSANGHGSGSEYVYEKAGSDIQVSCCTCVRHHNSLLIKIMAG